MELGLRSNRFLILQHEEHRVASLETKLSSLSETVGNYDRQRDQDQAVIL